MAMNCTSSSGQDSLLSGSIYSLTSGSAINSITGKEDTIKLQFITREGTYKLMNSNGEYCRSNRVGYNSTPHTNAPIKCSFISLPDSTHNGDKICFNIGKELYIYNYKGVKKVTDLPKPVDKRTYKGPYPTCHDFNQSHYSPDCIYLLVGFSTGQIQLIDPIKKEISKLFNEERLIDKTKVTCIKWIPGSSNLFLVSHSSGQLYVYKEDVPCGNTAPHYQIFKQGDGFSIYTCKTKSTRNPLYRWVIGDGSINEIAFSPCSKYLATVSQDGFLRVFNYDTMELIGRVRSYFGGLLCVCWSSDSKFVVIGGEDDLVTVWSLLEKRVIARGQGHKSWVSAVAFDPYSTYHKSDSKEKDKHKDKDFIDANDDELNNSVQGQSLNDSYTGNSINMDSSSPNLPNKTNSSVNYYRFGSVGQDTQLCLWDLNEDIIKRSNDKSKTNVNLNSPTIQSAPNINNSNMSKTQSNCVSNNVSDSNTMNHTSNNSKASDTKKEHKRNFSLGSRNNDKNNVNKASQSKLCDDPVKLLGTPICPRLDEVPLLEPIVHKKIAHERLTALVFREDCFVTACQEGFVCTWARPGKWMNMEINLSPSPSVGDINDIVENESGSTVV